MRKLYCQSSPVRALICITVFFLLGSFAGCGKSSPSELDRSQAESSEPAPVNQTLNQATSQQPDSHELSPGANKSDQEHDDGFFSRGQIPLVRITADQDALRQLENDPRTFVRVDVQS